jgi:hypothetical protein
MRRVAFGAIALVLVGLGGCSNAGQDRFLALGATGVVRGAAYFDLNGTLQPDLGDDSLRNVRVRLLTVGTRDSVAAAVTQSNGTYRIPGVPVGTYLVVVDTSAVAFTGDTVRLIKVDSAQVSVLPGDSVPVNAAFSYPTVPVSQARALPVGRKVFVVAVALNTLNNFRDTTVHAQDTSGAIRLTRLRAGSVFPGDSLRLRGTISRRSGLPTLDDVAVFPLGIALLAPASQLTTAAASTAQGGTLDARLAVVVNATINDTATVAGDFKLTVDDGSGALEVLLDAVADPAFRAPAIPGLFVPGNKFDVVGVLVPTGAAGLWRLKPRSSQDLTQR